MQADRHAGVARHPGDEVDVVLASEQIDVGACMPMRTADAPRRTDASTRATPVSSPSALRTISRCPSDTPAAGGVVGVDDDLGGLTEKFELRVEPAQLRPRHEHQRSGLPQRVQLVDGEQAASRPTARCAGPPTVQAIRGELSGAARSDARALGTP